MYNPAGSFPEKIKRAHTILCNAFRYPFLSPHRIVPRDHFRCEFLIVDGYAEQLPLPRVVNHWRISYNQLTREIPAGQTKVWKSFHPYAVQISRIAIRTQCDCEENRLGLTESVLKSDSRGSQTFLLIPIVPHN